MGICEILTILFVVLKLFGKIDWSWWLVLLPEIIGIAFYAIMTVISILSRISVEKALRQFDINMRKR